MWTDPDSRLEDSTKKLKGETVNFKIYSLYFITAEVALQNFDVQINKAIPGYNDLILTGQAIDDCAASCLNQEEWICNSFDYCFDTGYCLLSKLHPDERPGVVQNEEFCDLYSSKYRLYIHLTLVISTSLISK